MAVIPLLFEALAMPLQERDLVEARPGWRRLTTMDALAEALRNLGLTVRLETRSANSLTSLDLPCVVEIGSERPVVMLERALDGRLQMAEPISPLGKERSYPEGRLRICRIIRNDPVRGQSGKSLTRLVGLHAPILREITAYGWLAGLVALGYPLLVMLLFNNAIMGGATETVIPVFLIAGTLMVLEGRLRLSRAQAAGRLRERVQGECQQWVEEKLLMLPVDAIRAAPVVQQVQKMRDLAVQLSSALSSTIGLVIDLAFSVLLCLGLLALAPMLAIGPAMALVVLTSLMVLNRAAESRFSAARRQAQSRWVEGIAETISKAELLRAEQAERIWTEQMVGRWRTLSELQAESQGRAAKRANLATFVTLLAGLLTLWIGAHAVIDDTLSQGGLIACLMLIWKILSPVQSFAGGIDKIAGCFDLGQQMDRFLALKEEADAWPGRQALGRRAPSLRFDQAVLRADRHGTPIARQVAAEIAPQSLVLLDGGGTTAASRALEALLGIHAPLSGRILINEFNIRQFGQRALRTGIAYAPREIHLFPASIAENLRLAKPEASLEEVGIALDEAGLALDAPWLVRHLVDPIAAEDVAALPLAIGRRLCLARAWLRRSSLVLLDDPTAGLDYAGMKALADKLERLKHEATIVIASRDERLRALADKVLVV
ncbi:MAG: ATP-binding cassette domain-containing protein [Pseudomonadota bacterium]